MEDGRNRECRQSEKAASRFTKPVRVSMLVLLVAVAGLLSGGCEPKPTPRVDPGPSLLETRQPSRPPPAPSPSTATPRQSPKQSMERLIREMAGKPSLPSQETPGVARQKAEGGLQEKVSVPSVSGSDCPPAWWQREDPSGFLGGIGGPAESRESAEVQARLDIAKSIEVGISGTDTIQERETSDKGFEYSVESTIVERVNLSLTGFSIPKVGKCGNQWYARARLNRAEAENAWRSDLRGLDAEAETLRTLIGGKDKPNKDAFALMSAQYRLAVVLETVDQIGKRLPRLTGKPEPRPLGQGGVMAVKQDYESLIRSFRVELVEGDNQQAVEQAALPKPFGVQVMAGGDPPIPVAGVPVLFAVTKGQIEVTPTAKTGTDGRAEARGRYSSESSPAEDDAEVKATVRFDQMEGHYPDQLEALIRQQQEHLTVRFHVRPPVYHLVTKMKDLANEAKAWSDRMQTAREDKDVPGVMEALSRLHEVQMERDQVVERLRILHPPSVQAVGGLGKPALGELKRLVSSFEFRMVKGDNQQAVFGRSLDYPLEVQLVADLAGNEVPVSGVPVLFAFDQGSGDVDPPIDSTDQKGYARAMVHRVEPAENATDIKKAVLTARLNVTDLDSVLPASVRELFRRHVDAQVRRFRIDTPFPCSSQTPFDSQLYELACDLVRKLDSSVDKTAIVRDFVERASRQPHPLSARIEEALKAGLALTDQLQVLELPTLENSSIARAAEVEVSGVYELYRGNLLVKATLTRLTDHGLESASETTIPRAAVPKKDLQSLRPPTQDLFLLPKHSDFETHDEWVEAFWTLLNLEQEFRTWIKPQKSVYQDQENAVFFFKTERDCYLWVFAIDVAGNGAVLLPNTYRQDLRQTLVHASEGWVSIPGPADQFTLPISPPFGGERIKTFCTTRATPLVSPDSIRALDRRSPMFFFSRDNQRFRDVGVGSALSPGEWSEAHTMVSTIPQGRDATRGQRGLESRGF